MFKHLLVPLDGTRLAEAALPLAAYLAQKLDATVTLLHILEHDAPQEIHHERHLTDADSACAYLEEVAQRAFPPGSRVERHIHDTAVDDLARSLVAHTTELATPDLIVLCQHGPSHISDWLFGHLGDKVIALGQTPVLLVHPPEGAAPPARAFSQMFVPLDGSPAHEQALPGAIQLAQACASSVHLAVVIHTLGTLPGEKAAAGLLLPGTMTAVLEMAEENAEAYLRPVVTRLRDAGLTVTAEVARGDPASTIVSIAHQIKADLIVLGTHGKVGTAAFWAGSVAPRVSDRTRLPLLLVPIAGDDPAQSI
jgi:nucleotide-binding universal stress UspA family protein